MQITTGIKIWIKFINNEYPQMAKPDVSEEKFDKNLVCRSPNLGFASPH